MKYQRFTQSSCKDIEIKKFEFMTRTIISLIYKIYENYSCQSYEHALFTIHKVDDYCTVRIRKGSLFKYREKKVCLLLTSSAEFFKSKISKLLV